MKRLGEVLERTAERRGGSGAETGSGKKRSDFSISAKDVRSLDRDKHRGHNKVWINERGHLAATMMPESSVSRSRVCFVR